MWHFICISVTSVVCLCLVIVGFNKSSSSVTNTSIEFNFIGERSYERKDSLSDILSDEKNSKNGKIKIHIPKFMLDLYEERKREEYGLNFSKPDIVRSVIPKNAGTLQNSNILHSFEENHLLIFDVPSSNDDETFLSAELRILTLVNTDVGSDIGVERFLRISVYNESSQKLDLLDERHIYHSENTWINFNMTTPVHHILTKCSKHKYLKLLISIKAFLPFINYSAHHFKLSLLPIIEKIEHDYPILLLSYMSMKKKVLSNQPNRRYKRNIEEDYEEETNRIWDNEQQNKVLTKKTKRLKNTCRRKQLYIDFAEIQYDTWIVQPSGYEAYQCTGKCFYPVAEHLSPTKHAIVQALLHSLSPTRAPRSCCVPSKLNYISLLYVDERRVLTYRYEYDDMVVAECGCR